MLQNRKLIQMIFDRFNTLDNAAVEYIQRTMMEYLQREFVDNTASGSEESCKFS